MKAYKPIPVHEGPGDPRWAITVAVDSGDFEPLRATKTYFTEAEAMDECDRLSAAQFNTDPQ